MGNKWTSGRHLRVLPRRFEQYFEIEAEGPVMDVMKIQIHPFIKANIVPAGGDLP